MTQDRFIQLLQHPETLAGIPYEELRTLALAYPYTHNLRVLLAIKAKQEGHPDAERQRNIAAAYSLDRTRLFRLLEPEKQLVAPKVIAHAEPVLELGPIEELRKALEARIALEKAEVETAEKAQEQLAPSPPVQVPQELPEKTMAPAPSVPIETPPSNSESMEEPGERWISLFNLPSLQKPLVPAPVEENASEAAPAMEVGVPEEPTLNAQILAERSVQENSNVASETLARIFAQQGYKAKAIVMYERLCLLFPEKSAYFAAQIEKLKN